MSSVILEAHDLTKEYRHTVALDHIDLKIEKGKIYGFIVVGENRRKGIAGTEKADRLHDRNTCAFSDNDRLSKYGDTAYPTRYS